MILHCNEDGSIYMTLHMNEKTISKVVIPAFADYSSIEGILNVIEEVGVDKVEAVIPNLYKATKTQISYHQELKEALSKLDILFPEPIRELSQIEDLLDKGKTVWETRSQKMFDTQMFFSEKNIKIKSLDEEKQKIAIELFEKLENILK